MIRQEQCDKVCRILDDVLTNRPTERDSLIVAVQKAFDALEQAETNCSEIPNNWIPCSERLPEIDKEVLVTDGELCWVCSLFESQDIEDGLYQWEDNYGHWHEFETWVAWMPLPEPYQGGKQNGMEK